MNNYQNQTPPPVLRNHHQHQQQQHQQLHHNNHHFSTSAAATASSSIPSSIQLTPSHHMHQLQQQQHHNNLHQSHNIMQHHFTTPAAGGGVGAGSSLPPLPPTPQSLVATNTGSSSSASSSTALTTNLQTPPQQPQPLISNSLAIRQEIQRFESVHPSIYAIYDLIDLLPITDAQIAQQIRDHVVCIEGKLLFFSSLQFQLKSENFSTICGFRYFALPSKTFCSLLIKFQIHKKIIDSFSSRFIFFFENIISINLFSFSL